MSHLSRFRGSRIRVNLYSSQRMKKEEYATVDSKQWQLVQVPGLQAPKHQLSYDSTEVQRVLKEAFKTMFPEVVTGPNGEKRYQILSERGEDIFAKAKPVKNINDIPRAEMMRLMEGWIRLRRKIQEGDVPSRASSILLNFRVPNPRESLDRYMLYKEFDEWKLVIRWGYENSTHRAVSLERAISVLMDVPLGHMRSILSTTMSPSTSTVLVGQSPHLDEQKTEPKSGSGSQAVGIGVMAACAVIAVAAGAWWMLDDRGTEPTEQLVVKEQEQLVLPQQSEPLVVSERDEEQQEPELEEKPRVPESVAQEETSLPELEVKPRVPQDPIVEMQVAEKIEEPSRDMMAEMTGKSVPAEAAEKGLMESMLSGEQGNSESIAKASLIDAMATEKPSAGLGEMINNQAKPKSLLEEMSQ